MMGATQLNKATQFQSLKIMNFHNEIILHRKNKEKKTKWAPFGEKINQKI